MTYTSPKLLSVEEFISQYGDNTRYELIDGELRDMEPTGPHEAVAGSIAGKIYVEIFRDHLNWLVPKTCLIKPLYAEATALRPDVVERSKMQAIALGFRAGAELRSPMAVAIIGGLVTSTLLSLIVVPVVYALLNDLQPRKRFKQEV